MVPVSWCVQGWGFQPRLLVTVAFLRGPDLVGLGTSLGLVGKGPESQLKTDSADTLIFNLRMYSGGAVAI